MPAVFFAAIGLESDAGARNRAFGLLLRRIRSLRRAVSFVTRPRAAGLALLHRLSVSAPLFAIASALADSQAVSAAALMRTPARQLLRAAL